MNGHIEILTSVTFYISIDIENVAFCHKIQQFIIGMGWYDSGTPRFNTYQTNMDGFLFKTSQ